MNPYKISELQSQPGFESTTFETSTGRAYYVYFTDISSGAIKVHSFDFEIIGEDMETTTGPIDPRIADTLASILDDYFERHNGIIVYHPFNTDPRRTRLFDIWFEVHKTEMRCGELGKKKVSFTYDTATLITVCLIFKVDHVEIANSIVASDLAVLWDNKA